MNFKAYLLKTGLILAVAILMFSMQNVSSIYHSPSPGDGGDTADINANIIIEYTPSEPVIGDVISFIFTVKDIDTGSIVVHIDYTVKVLKDGEEVFRKAFHDHEGDLKVKFELRDEDVSVEGSAAAGGEYTVYGPVFSSPGSYTVSVSVVGIEFSPIDPFSNETIVNVLEPETPTQEPPQDDTPQNPGDTPPSDGETPPEDGVQDGDGGDDMMEGGTPVDEGMDGDMSMGFPLIYLYILLGLIAVGLVAFYLFRGRG